MKGCMTPNRICFVGQRGAGKTSLIKMASESFSCIHSDIQEFNTIENDFKSIFLELQEPQDGVQGKEWKNLLAMDYNAIVFVIDGSKKTGWLGAKALLNSIIEVIEPTTPIAIAINKVDLIRPDFSDLFEFLDLHDFLEIFQTSVRIFHTSCYDTNRESRFLDWIGEKICLFPQIKADEPLQVLVFRSSGIPIAYIGPVKEQQPWQDALLTGAYAALDLFSSFLHDGSRIKTITVASPDLDPRLLRVAGIACDPVRVAVITRGITPEHIVRFGEVIAYYFRENLGTYDVGKAIRYTIPRFFQKLTKAIGENCPCRISF
ncbi:MAG: Rab family GTPase [Candidatus Hodarchaeales archaeon]|jgi:signal recognition particle receptor subunit beta